VRDALTQRLPEHADAFHARAETTIAELKALHGELGTILAREDVRALGANHPAWRYVAARYELGMTDFDIPPDSPAAADQLSAVEAWHGAAPHGTLMWWEDQPTPEVLERLPQGIDHMVIDPLEQPRGAAKYDYVRQFRSNLEVLSAGYGRAAP
jgi:zinc transport system substrate-binding protein